MKWIRGWIFISSLPFCSSQVIFSISQSKSICETSKASEWNKNIKRRIWDLIHGLKNTKIVRTNLCCFNTGQFYTSAFLLFNQEVVQPIALPLQQVRALQLRILPAPTIGLFYGPFTNIISITPKCNTHIEGRQILDSFIRTLVDGYTYFLRLVTMHFRRVA